MSHHLIDPQREASHPVLAVDGRVKLTLTLAALLTNLAVGGVRTPLFFAVLANTLILIAGVRAGVLMRRLVVPLVMAAVAFATQILWHPGGELLLEVPLLITTLKVTASGVVAGMEVASRIIGGVSLLLFFALTTPLPALMQAAHWFRVPPVLVELALIMYRYIFLLMEEGVRIRTAQRSRLGYVTAKRAVASSGILAGMLMLRSFDRAERSFEAMRARGYRGALTPVIPPCLTSGDRIAVIIAILVFVIALAIR